MERAEQWEMTRSMRSEDYSTAQAAGLVDGISESADGTSNNLPEIDSKQDWQILSPSTVSLDNDYDMISEDDMPCRQRQLFRNQTPAYQGRTKPDAPKKLKSTFQRGAPLCEANMFGPLDWGLELMGGQPEPVEDTLEVALPPRSSVIEEVSCNGVVIYTICRDRK